MVEVQISDKDIEMLITGEKPFLCINESDFLNSESNTIRLLDLYGIFIGTAYVYQYSDVLYNTSLTDEEWFISRNDALQEMYSIWCEYKGVQPVQDGWLHSNDFTNYLKEIGWGGNYILYLTDIKLKNISKAM